MTDQLDAAERMSETTDGYPINQGTDPEETTMTGAVGEDGRVREKVAYDTTETRLVHTSGPLVGYEVNYPEDGDLSADQRAQIYTDSKFPPDYLTEEEVAELTNMEHAARVFQCMVIYNHLEDTSSGRVMPVADEDHTAVELDAHLKECASCSTMMDRMNEVTEAVPDVVTPVMNKIRNMEEVRMNKNEAHPVYNNVDEAMRAHQQSIVDGIGEIYNNKENTMNARRTKAEVAGQVTGNAIVVGGKIAATTGKYVGKASIATKDFVVQTGAPAAHKGLKALAKGTKGYFSEIATTIRNSKVK